MACVKLTNSCVRNSSVLSSACILRGMWLVSSSFRLFFFFLVLDVFNIPLTQFIVVSGLLTDHLSHC